MSEDLRRLLAQALIRDASQAAEQSLARPLIEAQRDELRQRLALYNAGAEARWEQGDFVTFKAGILPLERKVVDQCAWIFWRYLDSGSPWDIAMVNAAQKSLMYQGTSVYSRIDCIVATIGKSTKGLQFDLMDSQALTRAEAASS